VDGPAPVHKVNPLPIIPQAGEPLPRHLPTDPQEQAGHEPQPHETALPQGTFVVTQHYDFFPETWLTPTDWHKIVKRHTKGKVYIIKPENNCQGKGISLVDNPNKI